MAYTQPTSTYATHPIARAFGVDAAIVIFTIAAATLSFGTGQGASTWQNLVFAPLVVLLASVAVLLSYVGIRMFARTARTTSHPVTAVAEVLVPLAAMVIAGPMLLLMPFIFLGAMT